ncbi:MAG: ABC transporter ATP-binding protein [Parvibaculales bacterium]
MTDKTPPLKDKSKRKSRTLLIIKRVLSSYLRPFWNLLVLSLLTNIVVAATTATFPWLIQQAIDQVFNAKNQNMLVIIPIVVVIISLLRGAATFAANFIMALVGQRSTANLQHDLFQRLVRGDLAYISQHHSGEYIAIFMNDANKLRETLTQSVLVLARHIITVIALIGAMFAINWHLATIYTIIVVPLGIIAMSRIGKVTRRASRQGLEETGGMATFLSETLRGLRIVKAYGQEDSQIERARANINRIMQFVMGATRARMVASPSLEALSGIAVATIIFFGGYQSMQGMLTAGEFMGFITALLMVYQPLRATANMGSLLQEGVAAGTRIFAILDQSDEIIDKPNATALQVTGGSIRFEDVSFAYSTRTIPALNGVSLEVAAGQSVALVGASGSGKSTMINLVLRFFDVTKGRILIDDQDVRDVSLASLRLATGLVTQDPFLFDDTIAANIAFGNPNATQEKIEQAAKQAAAHEFISALPQGYDTKVGEGGLRLSGGQKQRVAIARAVLKDAPILLLDEATSSLDTGSEHQVQQALHQLMQGRTSLVIAHRLSTIMHADHIFVMDDGKIVETGKHEDLLVAGGIYADLYQKQFPNNGNI